MKGQLALYGIVMEVIALWLFLTVLYPSFLAPAVASFVLAVQANPTQFSDMTIILAQISPAIFLLGILLSIWFYATPHVETRGY